MPLFRSRPGRQSGGIGQLLVLGFLSLAQFSHATDRSWTGGTNTTWSTTTNWSGGVVPGNTDNAVFNSTFSNQPNLTATANPGGLWMTGSIGQNVTISGSQLTLQGNTINGTSGLGILVDNSSSFKLTISASLKVGAAQAWTNNSSNLLSISAVDLNKLDLTINGAGNTTISGVISSIGNPSLTKSGTGTLTLQGANSYNGATTVSAGILNIQTATALGSTGAGTTVSSGATLQIQSSITVGTEALTISGTGASGQNGALVNVSGTNTYGGLLTLGAASTISSDSGTLNLTNAGTITGATFGLTLTGSGNGSISSIIGTTSGALAKAGSGTWTLSGANTYSGGTTVTAGTLQFSGSGTLGATSGSLTVNGGTLDLNGTNQSVGNLTGSGGTILNNSTGTNKTLTIGTSNGGGGNYAGVIADHTSGTGTMALTKTGSGTITLSGANTFTGSTTVSNGTLIAAASSGSALGSTASITVSSGGTLQLGANDQINNSAGMTLNGGTFAKGNFSEGSTSASGVGALTLNNTSHIDFGTGSVGVLRFASFNPGIFTLAIDNWTGTPSTQGNSLTDRLIFESDQTANLGSFSFTGYTGAFEIALSGGLFEVVPLIPEPSTWSTGALALGALYYFERKACKRRKRRLV